jgi:hypothetical protein|tara:strand:+ start:373 stop:594 length:222 start_codon:yes stop_codon:yes gene_type:complete
MSRYKDYLMEWEDRINEIEGYEEKISESESLSETVDFVINKLKPKYEFEKVHIHDIVSEDWNEYWSKYYVRGC